MHKWSMRTAVLRQLVDPTLWLFFQISSQRLEEGESFKKRAVSDNRLLDSMEFDGRLFTKGKLVENWGVNKSIISDQSEADFHSTFLGF